MNEVRIFQREKKKIFTSFPRLFLGKWRRKIREWSLNDIIEEFLAKWRRKIREWSLNNIIEESYILSLQLRLLHVTPSNLNLNKGSNIFKKPNNN